MAKTPPPPADDLSRDLRLALDGLALAKLVMFCTAPEVACSAAAEKELRHLAREYVEAFGERPGGMPLPLRKGNDTGGTPMPLLNTGETPGVPADADTGGTPMPRAGADADAGGGL